MFDCIFQKTFCFHGWYYSVVFGVIGLVNVGNIEGFSGTIGWIHLEYFWQKKGPPLWLNLNYIVSLRDATWSSS